MNGAIATFWSALGGVCQAFSAWALSRSTWWSARAKDCFRRAR